MGKPGRQYVFISYAREDASAAQAIAELLEDHGIATFRDTDLWIGARWRSLLRKRLDAAAAVLVLWSSHAIASEHVCWEAARALRDDD